MVGCCGWAVRGGKEAYYKQFKTIELQETFYKLPRVETARKWREKAPDDFVFNMKAWQALTHPPTSPTWKRAGITVPKSKQHLYGNLKPSKENMEAWRKTVEIAHAVGAHVVVIQTPASFGYSEENAENAERFFANASTEDFILGWEPRGTWRENGEEVRRICERYNVVHVVDIFRWKPVTRHKIFYTRLHGIGKGEVNYSYRYTREDLEKLREYVFEEMKHSAKGFILFNNVSMAMDAETFKKML